MLFTIAEAIVVATFSYLIATIWGKINFRLRLRKCLVEDSSENVELFEYKGKIYDRNKFIQIQAEALSGSKKHRLEESLEEYELKLIRSKTPDLDVAFIEAYKIALERV